MSMCKECGHAISVRNTRTSRGKTKMVCGKCYLKQKADLRKLKGLA